MTLDTLFSPAVRSVCEDQEVLKRPFLNSQNEL